jgi:speckle-type POZ protein
VYRNGVLTSRCIVKGSLSVSSEHVRVGTLSFNKEEERRTRLKGEIAHVAVWRTALPHADIVEHWGKRLTGTEPNLISFFPLDEGLGAVGRDVAGRAGLAEINADWLLKVNVPPPQLALHLRSMVNNEQYSDIVLRAGNDGRPVYAHRVLLVARCDVFRAMFTGGMREAASTDVTLQDIEEAVLLLLLEFIYTDTVEVPPSLALPLLVAADRFRLERLQGLCEEAIAGMLDLENVCAVFEAADTLRAHQLRRICFNWILAHLGQLLQSDSFAELDRSLQREIQKSASSAHFTALARAAGAAAGASSETLSHD